MYIKVTRMLNSQGVETPDHLIIRIDDTTYLQSFGVIIAKGYKGATTLDAVYWNHFRPASYREQVLGESGLETHKKIVAGGYKLADLNR